MKRYLTQREADRCENAREPECKCRCGGAKHGAARVPSGGDFSILPADDPHYRPSMTKAEVWRFLMHAEDHLISDYRAEDWNPRQQARVLIQKARQGKDKPNGIAAEPF